MSFKSLSDFVTALESAGELTRIREFVSPHLEITEITDRVSKNNGKALLFENTGTAFPVLINAFGSERRMCMALGVDNLDAAGEELGAILKEFLGPKESFFEKLKILPALKEIASWLPVSVKKRAVCQEVVMETPDLTKLPVLTCWPADGGPFITLPVVHTVDPVTGIRNQGMYRMQVFGPALTGMHWHRHKGSAHHFSKYKELGKKMPVSVTLGGDPAYTYCATAPLPENLDEYMLAGFLRKKRVELVKCLTNDLEVPSDVDFVIEGYVDPEEEFILEGPFGDHTGFYSLADSYPRFHVTCITRRKEAIYPATIVGIPPMEDGWMGKATERLFLFPMKLVTVPEMRDINMPVAGVFHNIVLTKIEKLFPGHGMKVMTSLWGAGQMMFNKIMVVVSEDVDLNDYRAVAREVTKRTDPLQDIHFIKGPVDILDHSSSHFSYGSKMGIDATVKWPEESEEASTDFGKRILNYTLPLHPSPASRGGDGGGVNFLDPLPNIDTQLLMEKFPEVEAVNETFLADGISLAVVSVKKNRANHIREISNQFFRQGLVRDLKFILFLDHGIDLQSPSDIAWIAANNMDPVRDCFHPVTENGNQFPFLVLDGTRKTKEYDGFKRDWPNIIGMDEATIRRIDENWEKFGLGSLVPSPSIKYRSLILSKGAVSE
ncbi:MAG: menaquinone biosynthesis decarboxylase [Bacteroidetes bacterium]|nr:menaquinone biosynthesis decarboxylase [Bacteroidota bacterium]